MPTISYTYILILQVEALHPSGREGTPPILPAHSLAILALSNWLWGALGRARGKDLQALCLPLEHVPHIRFDQPSNLMHSVHCFATCNRLSEHRQNWMFPHL